MTSMGTPSDAALEVLAERVEWPVYVVMSMPALPIKATSHLEIDDLVTS